MITAPYDLGVRGLTAAIVSQPLPRHALVPRMANLAVLEQFSLLWAINAAVLAFARAHRARLTGQNGCH
jgi:hypothetical protein